MSLLVALFYLVGTALIGLWHARPRTQEEYFLGGRSAGTLMLAGSLIATIFGAFGVMGVAGLAYSTGLAAGWYLWFGSIGLTLMAVWALPRVQLAGVYTLPELMGHHYGRPVRWGAGLLIVISWTSIVAAQLLAAGKVVQFLASANGDWLASISRESWTLLIGLLVICYTLVGGQRSVMKTDLLQAILIAVGIAALFGSVLIVRSDLFRAIPASHWSFPAAEGKGALSLLEILLTLGAPYLVGPDMYSRVLSGRSVAEGRRAVLISAAFMVPMVLLIVLCGMLARALFPDGIPDADTALLAMATELLHPAMTGLIAAALLAAVMSSADTCLMTISTIVSRDLMPTPTAADEESLFRGRMVLATAGVVALLLANGYGTIIKALSTAYQLYSPGILLPFVALLLSRRHSFHALTGTLAMAFGTGTAALGLWLDMKGLRLASFAMPAIPLLVDWAVRRGKNSV